MERRPAEHPNRTHDQAPFDEAYEAAIRTQQRRERVMIGAWAGAVVVALVATVTLLESCGHSSTSTVSDATYAQEPVANQAVVASTVPVAAAGATPIEPSPWEGVDERQGTVPPDVIANASESFVLPGQPIEVTVEGTPDITEMALADGRGDAIPMVRDEVGNTWRVGYRVPLRPGTDRLGLSVTAKNESHRWRRVWLFLQVNDGRQEADAAAKEVSEGDSLR